MVMRNVSQTDSDSIASAVQTGSSARKTNHEISYMLAIAARLPSVFACAKDRLEQSLFAQDEARYVLLWRSVVSAAASGKGALPPDPEVAKELVAVCCAKELEADHDRRYYTPSVERAVMDSGGLLDEVYALPVDRTLEDKGYELLDQFLTERKVADPLRRALAGLSTQEVIGDPSALIKVLERHANAIAGFRVDPGSDAVVDEIDFLPPGPKLVTTKLAWLDDLLGGGQAESECYTLLGPTSGGKTVLATQIAIEGAEFQAALAADLGPDCAGHWYFFTWELSEDQMRERVYAYGARVHHDTFKDDPITRTRPPLSTRERPESFKPYESEPYVNSPGNPMLGERERIAAFNRRLSGSNSRLTIVDYSGKYPGHGTGGVDEVVTYLRKQTNQYGRKIAGFVMDYAGLAVNRYIGAKNLKPGDEYNLLSGFCDQVRSKICVPMKCPGWVLHQLHGDVTKRPAGAKIHHSDARGCRNFSDNADFGLQLSPYSKVTGLLTVHCTKHRRAPGREDGAIVKFDGRFGSFVSPDQMYAIDPSTREIVPADYLNSLPIGPAHHGRGVVDPRMGM